MEREPLNRGNTKYIYNIHTLTGGMDFCLIWNTALMASKLVPRFLIRLRIINLRKFSTKIGPSAPCGVTGATRQSCWPIKFKIVKKGWSCCSLWCGRCRHRYAKGLQQRQLDQILLPFRSDYEAAYERLRHVTVLSDLVPLHENDSRLKKAICLDRKRFNATKKAFPKIGFQGSFELELVDFKLLMSSGSAIKRRTIKSLMGYEDGTPISLIPMLVLVHSHSLWDLGPYPVDDVRLFVTDQFAPHAPYQVKFDRIYKDQPFDELSFKLGSYPFKDRVQFNLSFDTHSYEHGPYFCDRDLARFVLLYKRMSNKGFKTMLLGSKPKAARKRRSLLLSAA